MGGGTKMTESRSFLSSLGSIRRSSQVDIKGIVKRLQMRVFSPSHCA